MHEMFTVRLLNSCSDNLKSKTCTEPRRSIQNLKSAGISAIVVAFAMCAAVAQAQQPKKIPRIGYIATRSGPSPSEEAFLDALRSLGYIEGQTIAIEWRYAHENFDRLPELATEIVRLVELGFVASLARPGGNITGISVLAPELSGKLLELAKESIPKASRVAVLVYAASPNWKLYSKQMEGPARSLSVQLLPFQITQPDELESSFNAARRKRADALIIPSSAFLSLYRKRIAELAAQSRLPAMGSNATWAEEGCLLAYGPRSGDGFRRAAYYVDKILKGAKPADLPVEQPTKFELVINLKTAKRIGLTIPQTVLFRADKVIR